MVRLNAPAVMAQRSKARAKREGGCTRDLRMKRPHALVQRAARRHVIDLAQEADVNQVALWPRARTASETVSVGNKSVLSSKLTCYAIL